LLAWAERLRAFTGPVLAVWATEDKVMLEFLQSSDAILGSRTSPHRPAEQSATELTQASIGAQSGPVSPSFWSSLANSGVGLASGRPGSIRVLDHRACSAA